MSQRERLSQISCRNCGVFIRFAKETPEQGDIQEPKYNLDEEENGEQYKIAKADYEAFREKCSVKKM